MTYSPGIPGPLQSRTSFLDQVVNVAAAPGTAPLGSGGSFSPHQCSPLRFAGKPLRSDWRKGPADAQEDPVCGRIVDEQALVAFFIGRARPIQPGPNGGEAL